VILAIVILATANYSYYSPFKTRWTPTIGLPYLLGKAWPTGLYVYNTGAASVRGLLHRLRCNNL